MMECGMELLQLVIVSNYNPYMLIIMPIQSIVIPIIIILHTSQNNLDI